MELKKAEVALKEAHKVDNGAATPPAAPQLTTIPHPASGQDAAGALPMFIPRPAATVAVKRPREDDELLHAEPPPNVHIDVEPIGEPPEGAHLDALALMPIQEQDEVETLGDAQYVSAEGVEEKPDVPIISTETHHRVLLGVCRQWSCPSCCGTPSRYRCRWCSW